ncbi:MAG: hypothetical protein HY986_09135 [Candidatus Melainabacteria bacterium]|nr:hypothetical protein [Candidatus Melainabacteria bacterium]
MINTRQSESSKVFFKMRLVLILAIGCILIGATYAWSNNLGGQQAEPDPLAQPLPTTARKVQSRLPGNFGDKSDTSLRAQATPAELVPALAVASADGMVGRKPEQIAQTEVRGPETVTSIESARQSARATLGIRDPFEPLGQLQSFPRLPAGAETQPTVKDKNGKLVKTAIPGKNVPQLELVPPPPTGSGLEQDLGAMPGPHNGYMPPPLPGGLPGGGLSSGLALSDLPMPPEKPSVLRYLRLSGIIGDKAIFQVKDPLVRRANHWPEQITLAPGESFGTAHLVSVSARDEKAVMEEHGQMEELDLPSIR